MTWEDVIKIIAVFTGTGLTLASVVAFFIWLFKQWILNIFRKDLKQQEAKLLEQLKEKEFKWDKENKAIELRLGEEIRKSELQISKYISFEQRQYEILLESYNRAWLKLIDLEEYVIREYPYYLQTLNSKDEKDLLNPIRMKFHSLRKEILFLPSEVKDKVAVFIDSFFIDFNKLVQTMQLVAQNSKPSDGKIKISDKDSLNQIGQSLLILQQNLAARINDLGNDFQKDFLKKVEL